MNTIEEALDSFCLWHELRDLLLLLIELDNPIVEGVLHDVYAALNT